MEQSETVLKIRGNKRKQENLRLTVVNLMHVLWDSRQKIHSSLGSLTFPWYTNIIYFPSFRMANPAKYQKHILCVWKRGNVSEYKLTAQLTLERWTDVSVEPRVCYERVGRDRLKNMVSEGSLTRCYGRKQIALLLLSERPKELYLFCKTD